MDALTIERIKTLHPKIRKEVEQLYKTANNKLGKGVRLRFSYTFRTPEEQRELFKKRPKVTNADAWQSIHNYGLAFDMVLLLDKDVDGNFEEVSWNTTKDYDFDGIADWGEVVTVFKSAGYEWGGDWKFKDAPHFQKTFGHTWQQMKSMTDNGKFASEVIGGKSYKYISV